MGMAASIAQLPERIGRPPTRVMSTLCTNGVLHGSISTDFPWTTANGALGVSLLSGATMTRTISALACMRAG